MRKREAEATAAATEAELTGQWEARRVKSLEAVAFEEDLAARRSRPSGEGPALAGRAGGAGCCAARTGPRAKPARTRAESDRRFLDELLRPGAGHQRRAGGGRGGRRGASVGRRPRARGRRRRDQVEGRVRSVPVNLMAIDEFRTLEERHAHLSAQQKDLVDAMASLRETIKRINRNSRELFLEAFETIRGHYVETFKVLFNGGRADLVLEEGDDVLECGIEMIAQPPGKRLGNVSLMSGGEKSMAALALLFAIFRYQPSPFCLLDEVDAALDELNVGRFTRMLSEYAHHTQFILITHNKRSMEAANLLYGVTMEEAGVSKLVSMRL